MFNSALNCLVKVPFGPFTVTKFPSAIVTSTPAGIIIGLTPILDMVAPPYIVHINYQT